MKRVLRIRELQNVTGFSKSTLYRWIQKGDFPKPIHCGPGAVGWLEQEVEEWIETKAAARGDQ